LIEKYKNIPKGIDILLTHQPPYGKRDMGFLGLRVGCKNLLNYIENHIKPKVCVFGYLFNNNYF
jgi:Icc-related predicted phosphoesterase